MSSYGEKPIPQTPISSPTNSPERKGGDLPAEDKEMASARADLNAPRASPKANGNGIPHEERREEDAEEEDMDLDDDGPNGPLARFMNGGPNRVKVYELIGSGWHDLGTGFVRTGYDQVNDRAELVVSGEHDGREILRRPIHKEDVYQVTHGNSSNQREAEDQPTASGSGQGPPTLITWTEPDGQDYALSFQDSEGCADVWDFILDVQTHMLSNRDDAESSTSGFSPPAAAPSSPFSTSSVPSSPERLPLPVSDVQVMISNLIQHQELPVPQLGNINEIEQAFKLVGRNPATKSKLCSTIVSRHFWKQCIEVHGQAEDLESLEDLHALCKLAQTLLLLNDHQMYDYIVTDDVFFGVLGMLEYDPDFPHLKAGYRDFMHNVSHFRKVINMNPGILDKVHSVYRLQFLMDVVLARVLDDPVFNILKNCMLFQQVDIIQYFSTEELVLRDLFSYFDENGEKAAKAEAVDGRDKRGDIILLLHQLCMMAKMVQVPLRVTLYRRLVDKGLVNALNWGLLSDIPQIRSATGELLSVVVDHDSAAVRNFILNQVGAPPLGAMPAPSPASTSKQARKLTLLDTMQQVMLTPGIDVALKSQMADATRTLLEVLLADGSNGTVPPEALQRAREDSTIERFLAWFYQGEPVKDFFMPLMRLPEFQLVKKDPPTLPPAPKLTKAQVPHILYLTELLATFALQHTHRSSFFIMSSIISTRVGTLLLVKEKHIRIAALRFFRSLLKMGNQFVYRHLIGKNLFFPLIELAGRESDKDNLVSACYQEYFEYLKKENIRTVINEMMVSYGARIREIAQDKTPMGRIFEGLVLRWEQNNDSATQQSQPTRPAVGVPIDKRWGQGSNDDTEEDNYFNGSDDEEEIGPMPAGSVPKGLKRRTLPRSGVNGPAKPTSPRPASLVDYDDNEDEDMEKDAVQGSSTSPLEPSPHELSAAVQGADSPTVRQILRPRPLYSNGVKPSKGPPSPSLPIPSISRRRIAGGSGSESPESPRNGIRTPSPPPSKLGRKSPPPSPRAGLMDASSSPPRPGEKRKRDDDDDDDLLGSLERSHKRRSLGPELTPEGGMTLPKTIPIPGANKEGDGKKMKLKLGKSAMSVAGSATIPPAPPPVAAAAAMDTKDNG